MREDRSALEAGLEALRQGDRLQAISHFTQAIQTGDQQLLALYHRGQAYFDVGQIYEAVSDLTAALAINPGYVPALKARSLARLTLKNPVGALQDAEQMIQCAPQDAVAYQLGGVAARRSNQVKQAISYFARAARLYLTAGKAEMAKQCLAQAEQLRPKTIAQRSVDATSQNLPQQNSSQQNSSRQTAPQPPELGKLPTVATPTGEVMGLPTETIAALTTPKEFYAQAIARAQQGDTKGALRELSWALANVTIDEHALCCRGTIHSLCGQWQNAIKDFNQAIRLNPNYAAAYRGRGKARYRLEDYVGSIEDLSQALALTQATVTKTPDPTNISDNTIATADQTTLTVATSTPAVPGDCPPEIASTQDGATHEHYSTVICAMLYTARAAAYRNLGQLTVAMTDLNAAIALDTTWAEAYLERGKVYARQEELALAATDYQTAASLFCNQGRWDDYHNALDQAAKLRPVKLQPVKSQPVTDDTGVPKATASIDALQHKLLRLVGGYWEIAVRLLEQTRDHYPGMSDEWYLQYIIADIEDEYGSDL